MSWSLLAHPLPEKKPEKYIQDLYDSENCPKDIPIEAKEELNENGKGTTLLKSKVVKGITDVRKKKKATVYDNIPADLLENLGDNASKIMTVLVNKIFGYLKTGS